VQKFIESQKNVGTIAEQNAAKIQSQIDAIIAMSNAQGLSLTPVTKATTAIKEQTKALKKFNDEQAKITKEGRERALSYLDLDRAGIARAIPKPKIKEPTGPITSTTKEMDAGTRSE
jgi:hypothetical protein